MAKKMGENGKKKAKMTTTTRHIFTKKTLEGKFRVEKRSEIAL
jgi:translation elongation factor P/translation initiation factor 5A